MPTKSNKLIRIKQTYLQNSDYWLNHYRFFWELNCSSPQPDLSEINYYLKSIQEELSHQSRLKKAIQLLKEK